MPTMRPLMFGLLALSVAACARTPRTPQLAEDAMAAMGGADRIRGIQTLVMKGGEGTRFRLGQSVKIGDEDTAATLTEVIETLDLASGRAALDYMLKTAGGFSQHRQEVLTRKGDRAVGLENVAGRPLAVMSPSGLFSWGTQNSPEFLLRRNVVTLLLAAADSRSEETPEARDLNGRPHLFANVTLPSGEKVGLYFDAASKQLTAFEATDTETMLGDVPAQYLLSDYRSVDGVTLPHTITIRKGGQPYSEVTFAAATINDPAAQTVFAIPAAANTEVDRALAAGDYSPVTLMKVADGVYFARAYSHNSLVVEFPAWLAVVEAAYTEAQSKTLARVIQDQFPGKPIRYAAVTHHHYDHTGGVRGMAAQGATILVEKGQEVAMRALLESPHTNPADDLATRRAAQQVTGTIEVYEGKKVLSDGGQTLELYAITGNPHVDPKVIAYVPTSRVLFQSDLWIPGVGGPANADAIHLLESVRALKLRVDTNVGGHGGVAPFAELVKAAAAARPAGTN